MQEDGSSCTTSEDEEAPDAEMATSRPVVMCGRLRRDPRRREQHHAAETLTALCTTLCTA